MGLYVRTGPARRLPKGPPWPGHSPLDHVQDARENVFHWLSHKKGIVSCAVCGPVGRQRWRDRRDPYGHLPVDWEYRMARRLALSTAVTVAVIFILAVVFGG